MINERPDLYHREILRVEVGSTCYGTGKDGEEDLDLMGVAVERPEDVVGLGKFAQHVARTQPEGIRSGPGDIDLTVYGLRKFVRLACDGNPSILVPLYAPMEKIVTLSQAGIELRALAPFIVSRRAIPRYLGYMRSQALRMVGEKGSQHGARALSRGGKFAMHMLRLGMQGLELFSTGQIELPMRPSDREYLLSVRHEEISAELAFRTGVEIYLQLEHLYSHPGTTTPLRDEPDYARINEWLKETYLREWSING